MLVEKRPSLHLQVGKKKVTPAIFCEEEEDNYMADKTDIAKREKIDQRFN